MSGRREQECPVVLRAETVELRAESLFRGENNTEYTHRTPCPVEMVRRVQSFIKLEII